MWKKVEGFNNYEVSDSGFVRNIRTGRVLKFDCVKKRKGTVDSDYLRVTLCENNTPRKFAIHRLVAKHFLEDYSEDLEVNHKNGNRFNNLVSNLEMVSSEQNRAHALETGLCPKGEEHGNVKYTEQQANLVITLSREGYSRKDVAEIAGVTVSFVKDIRSGKAWKHLPR